MNRPLKVAGERFLHLGTDGKPMLRQPLTRVTELVRSSSGPSPISRLLHCAAMGVGSVIIQTPAWGSRHPVPVAAVILMS